MAVDSTLPKQLQAELEAAEAIQAQITGTAPQANTEPEPAPDNPQTQDQPANADDAPPAAKAVDSFEAKYKVLEGKYRAEVPQLNEKLKAALQRVDTLSAQVQELANKQPEPKEDPLVTSKDEEAFGADLIDLARRVVKEETSTVAKRLATVERALAAVVKVSEKVERIEVANAQTAEERFWADVNTLVPDWQDVDNDPRWIEFLDTRAKGAAKTYRELAQDAILAGQSKAVAELVEVWKDVSGITAERAKQDKKQRELESQAQPGKSKATADAPKPGEGRIWTWAEYEKVFSPNISREYTAAQVAELQAEAEKAYLEGRIR